MSYNQVNLHLESWKLLANNLFPRNESRLEHGGEQNLPVPLCEEATEAACLAISR